MQRSPDKKSSKMVGVRRGRQSPPFERPNMSDLRIVLLGRNITENSSVGNFILGRAAFESKAPSADVHIEREKGKLQDSEVTVINAPQLLISDLSSSQITQAVKEIVNLSAPGPHVIILILQQNDFTEKDRNRVLNVLNEFSEEAIKHTTILTKEEEINNNCFHQLIQECGGGHLQFDQQKFGCQSEILEMTEKILKEEKVQFLICDVFEDAEETLWEEQQIQHVGSVTADNRDLDQEDGQIKQQHQSNILYLNEASDDVRIVLLGKTGVGKSATGNTILGREAFEEDVSIDSVTKECQRQTAEVNGRSITVIDTPGLFDTKLSQENIQREITECISMILPGPHVFLLLIPVGRFTQEEQNTVKVIQQTFGKNSLKYTIVLFTKGDGLKKKKKKTIEEFLGEPGSSLMNLIEQCGNRYHVFNNNETEDRTQVTELLQKINDMVMENGGSYYSCKIFRQMEREKQEAQMKMLMNEVEQQRREIEELLAKQKNEKEKFETKLEAGKQNFDAQSKRREEEFEKNKEKEQKKWEELYQRLKEERDEIRREKERIEKDKENLQDKLKIELENMQKMMKEERQNHEAERRRRDEEFKKSEELYKTDLKREQEKLETKLEAEKQKFDAESKKKEDELKKNKEKEQKVWDELYQRLKEERDEIRGEKADLVAKHEAEIKKMEKKMEEERQNHDTERRRREEEFNQKEQEYRTRLEQYEEKIEREKLKREEETEKMKEKEQNIIDQCDEKIKKKTEEITRERERVEREKKDLQAEHKAQIEEMKTKLEEERQSRDTEKRRREEEFKQKEEEYKIKQEKYEDKIEEIKTKIEEERQNHDTERRRREEEFKQKEEEYKIKQERYEDKIEKEKQKREKEHEKMKEKEQNIIDQCDDKIKIEREKMKREMERIETEKEDLLARYKVQIEEMKTKMEEERQNHDTEKRIREEEYKHTEEEYKTRHEKYEEKIEEMKTKMEEERMKQDELMRQRLQDIEVDRSKEIEDMKMCCPHASEIDETAENPKLEPNKHEQLKELYDRLNLTKQKINKLGTAEILEISKSSFQAHEPQKENKLVNLFLQKLINMDYRARYTVIKHRKKDKLKTVAIKGEDLETGANYKPDIHPMDVQMAVFHFADVFLKQLMMTKLSQCQFALPLLVPDPFTQQIEFPLWTFRQINKSWKMKTTNNETISQTQPIYKAETPMVFFFRFGSVSSSKSQLVNSLINEKHNTFFHRNCPGRSRTRLLMDGVVEIAWYCPSGRNIDSFDDCVAFCNLHGDAADNQKQYEILTSMSSVNVLFLPDFGQMNHYKGLVTSLCKSPQPLICLLTDNNCDKTELGNGNYKIGLSDKNQCDTSNQIRETIRETLQKKTFRLEDVAKHPGIRVDEEDPECQRGKQAALKIMNLLRGKDPSTVKETILPCQGKLWHDWCKMNKELHRLRGENLEEDKSSKLKKMREIREEQVTHGLSEFMRTFIEQMNSQRDNERKYFLRWMMNMLDEFSSEKLCELHKEYDAKWHQVLALKKMPDKEDRLQTEKAKLENTSELISHTGFGLEHIMRECGQIYESCSAMKKNRSLQFDFSSLPCLAAEMIISGFPLELMDGDAAHVPLIWVSAVLDELVKKLGDQRLFVLSVLGIQSSGKSTMLNALFGLQFAVSAGRCTRGAFMQLVRVSDEMKTELNFDYILVVDTEGLRAPELSGRSTTHRDNEMATFVVGLGNMTLINILGENPSEMQDILQIVVQAFMRMKKIKLNPSCMFVHQNVTDITAGEKNMEGRRRLVEKLDEMTKTAAKEEVCDVERFNDVIGFDVQKDVKYFPQLWEGSPPMAPPNPNYCENILELKETILRHASQSDGIMLTQLRDRINDLWEASFNEKFVFSFKNSLEIATYKKLETEYSKWTWSLRSAMLEIEQKLHNQIENEAIQTVEEKKLQTELKEKSEEVKKKMSEFFENDRDANILNQWKGSFQININQVQENIVRETLRKLNGVLQRHYMKKKMDAQKTHHENTLFEKSKELALQFKEQANDKNVMKMQFDAFWKQHTIGIIRDMPLVKDIDILRDVRKLLCESCASFPLDRLTGSEYKDMSCLPSYSEYVQLKKTSGLKEYAKKLFRIGIFYFTGHNLSEDDEVQIRALISDIADHTDKMIWSYNIAKVGYNISCIQQLKDYIKARLEEHVKGENVEYVFKHEFFIDLVLWICHRSNKTFADQYQMFREVNDPVLYFERKSEEYNRIFQKYCQGASSTAVFGEFVCNKLKEPIEQSVYKTTARDIADEMKTNCESLNGNRSNLEKHILKTLAEKQDFQAYIKYIKNPREHFKNFIRDEVNQFVTKKFENRVRPKMENCIKVLQQQITNAACESSKHVEETGGNVGLWLRHFTQQLSGVLVFSESDLTGVNQDGVEVSILEDVIKKELPFIIFDISSKFIPETFPLKLEQSDRPDEILIAHFCQCCWVQCPFCAAICTNTIEDHPGDHSVPFHRNIGLNGWSYRGTTNLAISICTSAVASDRYFRNSSDESILWREYRKAGPKYASWSITPDLSELPYWKWFVCRFQNDLEKHYENTYEGSGKIPDEWRKHSQEEAIESLNKYI